MGRCTPYCWLRRFKRLTNSSRARMEAAATAEIEPQMGRHAKELYEAFDAAGNGGFDFSAIIKTV